MTIQKIKITNLLSFDEIEIDELNDINCIVGRNNVGKSNLLKTLKFFYNKLEGKEELPPRLNSNYSYKGTISITFDTTRIFRIARRQPSNKYFSFIVRKLIPIHKRSVFSLTKYDDDHTTFTLSLNIYNDGKVKWSTNDKQTLNLILYLYPFFHIEPRHMNLHEWDSLWDLISRIKSFNLSTISEDSIITFFDESINTNGDSSYKNYIKDLNDNIFTKPSTQKEKILSYIKAGLKGYNFEIDERDLKLHSDGTNSFHFIKTYLNILITISRREYITPFIFIDEPELGLHPKMNEVLIHDVYSKYKYNSGRNNKVTRPKVFIATHSPNIIKEVIKKFRDRQRVYCFRKNKESSTSIRTLNSTYDNESFINIFSDNEARLFFSDYILFVEGETELEIFGNMKLAEYFPHLKNIDVYKSSSNVIGERINPSYSNSSIPYMFLFDADKAISINGGVGLFTINYKKNGEYFSFEKTILEEELKKHKLGFSKIHRELMNNTSYLIRCINKKLDVNLTTQNFSFDSEFEDIFNAIKKRLLLKNIYINRTTIEGCLIQNDSLILFYEWAAKKYDFDISIIDKLKIKTRKYLTQELLADYFRVIFNGKTKTLIDYKHFNFNAYKQAIQKCQPLNDRLKKTSTRAKVLMNFIEEHSIANKDLDKTDGWTTNFINYAVEHIANQSKAENKSFGSVFKVYFPELYDIIRRLQPDSRGEI
ncbi:retron Eco8 family effector endonuclease [Salmonella enterica]